MNNVNVYEQPLPGLGQRFDLELDQHHILTVVALRDGRRQLMRRRVSDEAPTEVIDLNRDQAATIGALLLGAQFSISSAGGVKDADQVIVDTITVTHHAPAVNQTPSDALRELGRDVVVLAVIRDQTPELVERDPHTELLEGDRVAIAARRSHHPLIKRALSGP